MGTGRPPGRPRKNPPPPPETREERSQRLRCEAAAYALWEANPDPFKGGPPRKRGAEDNPLTDDEKWTLINAGYRTGLPIATVARLYGIQENTVRQRVKRARERGDKTWDQDLLAIAEALAKEKLDADVRMGVTESPIDPDLIPLEAQITAAARVKIVQRHRTDISKLLSTTAVLMDRLDEYMRTGDTRLPWKGDKESPADVIKKAADALRFLIPLERQALGIADAAPKEDPNEGKYGIAWMPPKDDINQEIAKADADEAEPPKRNPFEQ